MIRYPDPLRIVTGEMAIPGRYTAIVVAAKLMPKKIIRRNCAQFFITMAAIKAPNMMVINMIVPKTCPTVII